MFHKRTVISGHEFGQDDEFRILSKWILLCLVLVLGFIQLYDVDEFTSLFSGFYDENLSLDTTIKTAPFIPKLASSKAPTVDSLHLSQNPSSAPTANSQSSEAKVSSISISEDSKTDMIATVRSETSASPKSSTTQKPETVKKTSEAAKSDKSQSSSTDAPTCRKPFKSSGCASSGGNCNTVYIPSKHFCVQCMKSKIITGDMVEGLDSRVEWCGSESNESMESKPTTTTTTKSTESSLAGESPMFQSFYKRFNCTSEYFLKIPTIDEEAADAEPIPKFYLDEELFDNTIVEDCVRKNYSDKAWEAKGLDPFYGIKTGEASFDYFVLKNMRTHPSRTKELKQAKFYFLGMSLSFYDVVFHNEGRCNADEKVREKWLNSVGKALMKIKDQDTTLVIFVSVWGIRWPDPFDEIMKKAGDKILFAVPDNFGFVNHNRNASPKIKLYHLRIVPYKATSYLEDTKFKLPRNYSFYFAGNMNRNRHGQLRTQLRWMGLNRTTALVIDNDFREEIRNHTDGYDGKKVKTTIWEEYISSSIAKSRKNSERVKQSRFCLIPVGDTSTSRRLFDSMAAGCIPVYIGPIGAMYKNLPMTSQINWRSLMLFSGAFGCVNVIELAEWLDRAEKNYPEEVENLAKRNYEVFHKYLSPFVPGFLSAFLRELGKHRVFSDIESFIEHK